MLKDFSLFYALYLLQFLLPRTSGQMTQQQTGIVVLLCHRDVSMFLLSIHSLFYHLKSQLPVYVVDDGTLTRADYRMLRYSLPSIRIESAESATRKMRMILSQYPNISLHRFSPSIGSFKYKLDALLLNPFEKFILVDADLLFLQKPTQIAEWIESDVKQSFYTAHREECYEQSFFPEYSLRKMIYKHIGVKMTAGFSSGLLMIADKGEIDLEYLNKMCKVYKDISAIYSGTLEESLLSLLAAHRGFKKLSQEEYMVMSLYPEYEYAVREIATRTMIHFGWQTKRKFFIHCLKQLVRTHWYRK